MSDTFNTGRDWTIDFLDPLVGGVQSWPIMTAFSKKQNTTRIMSRAMNGTVLIEDLPDTWEGTMVFDRASPALDRYIAAKEAARRTGQRSIPCSIIETVQETDGSVSQFRYKGVSVVLENGGESRGDAKVEQSVSWIATSRETVF